MQQHYAYHKPLGPIELHLQQDFLLGMSSVNLDRSKIEWGNLDPNDPAIGYSSGELKKDKAGIRGRTYGFILQDISWEFL